MHIETMLASDVVVGPAGLVRQLDRMFDLLRQRRASIRDFAMRASIAACARPRGAPLRAALRLDNCSPPCSTSRLSAATRPLPATALNKSTSPPLLSLKKS